MGKPSSHQCTYSIGQIHCNHKVRPPQQMCWQHRQLVDTSVTAQIDAAVPEQATVFVYKQCRLHLGTHGLRVSCALHESTQWEVIGALGGQIPCVGKQLQENWLTRVLRDAKTVAGVPTPKQLEPMRQLAITMFNSCYQKKGGLRGNVSVTDCRRLYEKHVDPEPWFALRYCNLQEICFWHCLGLGLQDAEAWSAAMRPYVSETELDRFRQHLLVHVPLLLLAAETIPKPQIIEQLLLHDEPPLAAVIEECRTSYIEPLHFILYGGRWTASTTAQNNALLNMAISHTLLRHLAEKGGVTAQVLDDIQKRHFMTVMAAVHASI